VVKKDVVKEKFKWVNDVGAFPLKR
jgi:hypothetical protein